MKRNLILTIVACSASLMLGAAAHGQTPTPTPAAPTEDAVGRHGHRGGGGILAHLTMKLGLSGTQQEAVAQILEGAKPQAEEDQAEAMAKRKALIESVSAQITPLLTPDQQAKFAVMVEKAENGQAAGEGGLRRHAGKFAAANVAAGAGGADGLLARLTAQLGLTAAQQGQIKPMLEAAHAQIVAARTDKSLTPDQKFAKIKETMDATRSQINGALTPEQQAKLARLKGNRGKKGEAAAPAASAEPTTTGS